MAVQSIQPKIGNTNPKLKKFLSVVDNKKFTVLEQGNKPRRHTIPTEFDLSLIPSRKISLRDELLRNLADKEMKSRSAEMLIAKDTKKSSITEMKTPHTTNYRRRSSIVSDIIKVDTAFVKSPRRKSSLVSDVVMVSKTFKLSVVFRLQLV